MLPVLSVIEFIPELTNLWSYSKSTTVTPIETKPLYPEPCPVVPKPTDMIVPPAPTTAVTEAPTSGANPSPGVDPYETIIPPLGTSFRLTS